MGSTEVPAQRPSSRVVGALASLGVVVGGVDRAPVGGDRDGCGLDGNPQLRVNLIAVDGSGNYTLAADHGDPQNVLARLLTVMVVRAGASPYGRRPGIPTRFAT